MRALLALGILAIATPARADDWAAPTTKYVKSDSGRFRAVVAGPGLLAPLATRPVVHALHHVVTGVYTFSRQPMPIPDSVTAVIADMSAARLLPLADLATGARLRELIQRNHLVAVEVATPEGLHWIEAKELHLAYRHCELPCASNPFAIRSPDCTTGAIWRRR